MKEQKYWRERHVIVDLTTGKETHCTNKNGEPSINAAKKLSRQIQITEDGALGRGSLRVVA